jgi:hypothetical protein
MKEGAGVQLGDVRILADLAGARSITAEARPGWPRSRYAAARAATVVTLGWREALDSRPAMSTDVVPAGAARRGSRFLGRTSELKPTAHAINARTNAFVAMSLERMSGWTGACSKSFPALRRARK